MEENIHAFFYVRMKLKIQINMKKITYSLLAIFIASTTLFTACNNDEPESFGETPDVPVTGVTLNQTTATLGIGSTLQLTATVLPDSATNQNVTWSSSNPTVASVLNGTVIGLTIGTAVITVTTQCGNKVASCAVTVVFNIPVVHIELDRTADTIDIGDTLRLIPTIFPENATNKTVTWLSTNPAVATVDEYGVVTAVTSGITNIVATTQDGNMSAVCAITVAIPVTSLTLSQTTATLFIGNSLTLTATVLPENATFRTVVWSSDNPSVATVDSYGIVTGISAGTATIIVATEWGNHTAMSTIDVSREVHCNFNTPNWGENLETVSFYTNQTWTIGSQIWSDVVTATGCQKTAFDGGLEGNFNADCRTNLDISGDLFSWCAVYRFGQQLCPYPWRVPTVQDFIDLDIALGGTGARRYDDPQFVLDNYITRWGGIFGGGFAEGLWGQGSFGNYWSKSQSSLSWGIRLYFITSGIVDPQQTASKSEGYALRCVRDL